MTTAEARHTVTCDVCGRQFNIHHGRPAEMVRQAPLDPSRGEHSEIELPG